MAPQQKQKRKTPQDRKVSTAGNWKKRSKGRELLLPSGEVCLVKRPGMEKLLEAGIMPDSLTPLAMDAIKSGDSGGKPDSEAEQKILEEMLKDQNTMADMFVTFDKVTAMCVLQPTCRLHFTEVEDANGKKVRRDIPEEDRDEDVLYTDEVDPEDKSFIFQFVVGGTDDLATFRQESGADVADVRTGEDVGLSSE